MLPERFPIKLERSRKMIIDPTMGVNDQFVITANGLEIARFLDEESCTVWLNFLGQNITKCLSKTPEGRKILEMLYALSEKEKLKPEYDAKGSLIVRDMKDKNIIH